jgi:hypothetical protein
VDGSTALGMLSAGSCGTYYQHVWDAGYSFGVWVWV